MLELTPISKMRVKKTAEIVAGQIRNAIIRGELRHGDNLPAEAQLIAQFEVSRPTVREAIRILESENLIQVSRGARGGARITKPTNDLVSRALGLTLQARQTTLGDIYKARMVIEPPAARMAAEIRPKEAAAVLRVHVMHELAMVEQRPQIARAVADFHRLLVEQCGNQTLAVLAAALRETAEKHLSLIHRSNQEEETALQVKRTRAGFRSHERLVDLIEAGDGAGAERHWHEHMEKASEYWLRGVADNTLDILD